MTVTREQILARKQQATDLYSSGHLAAAVRILERCLPEPSPEQAHDQGSQLRPDIQANLHRLDRALAPL